MKKEIVRTTKHNYGFSANTEKQIKLYDFLSEHKRALQIYIDYLFNNTIIYNKKEIRNIEFSLQKELYQAPSMLDYKIVVFETTLSARALSSAMTQACGIIKGIANKRKIYKRL